MGAAAATTDLINPETGLPYQDHIINGDFQYLPGISIPSNQCAYISIVENSYWYTPMTEIDIRAPFPNEFDRAKFGWLSTQQDPDTFYYPFDRSYDVQIDYWQEEDGTDGLFCDIVPSIKGTAIYQDIATAPNAIYRWSLKHRNMVNTDKMSVMIGTPEKQEPQPARRTSVNGLGDELGDVGFVISSKTASPSKDNWHNMFNEWETYEGIYKVPAGQNITRFTFKDLNATSTTSNFVDDISFTVAFPLLYDLGGGTTLGNTLPQTIDEAVANNYAGYKDEDSSITPSSTIPTREGYKFLGWTETKVPDIDTLASYNDSIANDCIVGTFSMPAHEKTLYASWAKNPTVSYIDPLDDNKVVYSTEIPFGSAAPELTSSNILAHDHYDFTGYATPLPQEVYEDTIIPLAYKGSAVKLRIQLINAKNGSPLRWAGFKISADAKTDIDTLSLITDPNGCATFDGIAFGDYTAHLVDRPEGFLYSDYAVDFSAVPTLADTDGYITVEIPVMPQLSRRTSEYESDNTFDFYYPAWIAVYGDDELVMGRGTGYPYASYDGKPLNEKYIWLDVERRELGTRPFWDVKEKIKSVKVIDRIRPLNPQMWFLHFSACTSYDITKLDMSACTSLQMFFGGNHAAEEIDVTGWDTSNVTTMAACFSSWGTNPDGTDFIFKDNKLKRIKGLETWDTSKCELFGDAFSRNWNLEDIGDIGGWDMSSTWSVHHMFVDDLKLKTNVSGWRRTINPEVIGIGYCDVEKKTMCFNGYNEVSGGHSSYAAGVIY